MKDDVRNDLILLENLTAEYRILESQIDEIKARVIVELPVGSKIEASEGTFTVSQRSKWQYTPETQAREKSVKESQKREQQTGLAIESKGEPFIVYKSLKDV